MQKGANTIGNTVCDMIDVRESDGLVVVASHGHGIFSAKLQTITSVNDINDKGLSLNLANYPNPFSDKTSISFSLKEAQNVKLKIYDGTGKQVKVLAEEKLYPGKHSFELQRAELSSGVYYCTLEAGSAIETKKLVILK